MTLDIPLDEVSVHAYLNSGPLLDGIDIQKFISQNALGSPIACELHSSINGMYRYGWLLFNDRSGIRETLPLTGNEIISLRYFSSSKKYEDKNHGMIQHFNIFDIEEIQGDEDGFKERFSNKLLKIHIIEAPLFLKFNTEIWTRSYGKVTYDKDKNEVVEGKRIDEIFSLHLNKDHNIKSNDKKSFIQLDFNKIFPEINMSCPGWKTQMFFNYLLEYAKDDKGNNNVKFYPTTDLDTGKIILNLKSINQMFENKKIFGFSIIDSAAFTGGHANRTVNQILKYKFLSYDLSALASGLPGGHLMNYSYTDSRYYTMYDSYNRYIKNSKMFYNFGLWSDKINNKNSKRYYRGQQRKEMATTFLQNRITEHTFQIKCEIITYIDEAVQVGDKVVVLFPSGFAASTGVDTANILDEQMSGAWIVEEIVDTTVNGRGGRKMVMIKDSFLNIHGGESRKKTILPEVNSIVT